MKNWKYTFILSAMILTLSSVFSVSKSYAQGYGQVSFDMFYDELSPYGYWDRDNNYGDIWYPNEGRNFRPYDTNGYWTMTEYGNTWVSNYDWGWAPFHYGRWVHNSYRGWGWIPGYEWGPAWVDWRSGNGYYGWAPMMPRSGISISINLPISAWIFAPVNRIFATNYHRYAHYGRTNIYNRTTIINNTYIVNNNTYYGGPSRRDMERTTGRRIDVREIRQSDRPGSTRVDRNSVSMYRPERDNSRSVSRDNNRSASRNNSSVGRNDNGRVSENRSNRTESNNGRNNSNAPRREMHIGQDGNVTMRDRATRPESNTTRERSVSSDNNNNNNNRVRGRENGNTSAERVQRPQREISVERNQPQRQAPQQERVAPTRESRTQNAPQVEHNRNQAPPQREQRGNSTRERSVAPVQQAVERVSSPVSTRESSSRIDRSSSSNRGSAVSSSRGAGSERSRR